MVVNWIYKQQRLPLSLSVGAFWGLPLLTAGQMHRETIVINGFISAQVLWPTADCYRCRYSVSDQGVYIDLSRVHRGTRSLCEPRMDGGEAI